ncbi:MAG: glycosyltransferase [Chloroflexi bacterium]|nr:glycosyltransferase [Chloroflexota bacterium]
MDTVRVSLTMIVKNEEKNLARVITSARAIADELIVVDTGSTDRTVAIAEELGARVFRFSWIGDFSAARNYALAQASGNWVLILDGDDIAHEREPGALRRDLAAQPDSVMFLRVPVRSRRWDDLGYSVSGGRRLFRRVPEIRWIFPIHENVVHAADSQEMEASCASLTIEHTGYVDPTTDTARTRHRRNMRLLRQELAARPDAPELYYYLATQYGSAGYSASAVRIARSGLARFRGRMRPDFAGLIRTVAMRAAMQMGKPEVAIAIGTPGMSEYAYSELAFTLGCACGRAGDLDRAERYFQLAIALRGRVTEYQVDAGTGSWKALIELGSVAWKRERHDLALERWRRAHETMPSEGVTAYAYGRGLLAVGRRDEALPLLARAVEQAPNLVDAHRVYAQALVQEGRSQEALEHLTAQVERRPENATYWMLAGELLHHLRQYEACVDLLGAAIERHQTNAHIYVLLGSALRSIGRTHDAFHAFALAAAINPASKIGRAGLRSVARELEFTVDATSGAGAVHATADTSPVAR